MNIRYTIWAIFAGYTAKLSSAESVCGSVVDAGSSGSRLYIHSCDLINNAMVIGEKVEAESNDRD